MSDKKEKQLVALVRCCVQIGENEWQMLTEAKRVTETTTVQEVWKWAVSKNGVLEISTIDD